MRWLFWFVAGFLAVLSFHQPAVALLHGAGVIPFPAFSFSRTAPFGVPAVFSSAFFGGLWAILMFHLLARTGSGWMWFKVLLFGGIAPTLVALFVVFPLKGHGLNLAQFPARFAIGFVLNALWGVGALVFVRVLPR